MLETDGLGEITAEELYENGVRVSVPHLQAQDVKRVYYSGDIKRVVNYPDGYLLDIPRDWEPDFTMGSVWTRYRNDEVTLVATKEEQIYRYYGTAEAYIENIFQYITTETYRKVNRVEVLGEENFEQADGYKVHVRKMHLMECDDTVKSFYTYVIAHNGVSPCVQLMFKAVDNRDFSPVYRSLRVIPVRGKGVDTVTYLCRDNPSWNDKTRAFYHSLRERKKVLWGIFAGNLDTGSLEEAIPALEKKIAHKFPLISSYTEMDWNFPLDEARQLTREGRILQYTHHFSRWTEEVGMGKEAPILDIYRGKKDDDLRRIARQIAQYGEPMLFRVNNEMNSDWTCWAAHNAMLDPEIFTDTWIRMYRIFEEEGANANCIWEWNPNADFSVPRANWNEIRTYMPGPEYVHAIGLTYYNFGSDTLWDSFDQLYGPMDRYYGTYFRDWPWIIGEFACSDTQTPSRKSRWIAEMFDSLATGNYPNIKAAVWFSCNDYDSDGNIVHLLLLDESEDTCKEFREGLARTQ